MKRLLLLVLLLAAAAGSWGAYQMLKPVPHDPQHFADAARLLADSLKRQLTIHRGLPTNLGQATAALDVRPGPAAPIVVAPFVDANFGEGVQATRDVQRMIADGLGDGRSFTISPLTPASLIGAEYVMFGILILEDHFTEKGEIEKRYHVVASVVDRQTRRVAAQATVWIAEADLDYTPSPLYRDSPMFPRDQRLASLVTIARSKPGTPADHEYYDSLETNALMAEAEGEFDVANYAHARSLFKQATERKDGQVMKGYLGLYRCDVKLNKMSDAESAFADLVAVSADNGLNTKFLFAVNSTDFIADGSLRAQYGMWTRQIGRYFSSNGRCLAVVGHCSRTGAGAYNESLSLARAEHIRERIIDGFPPVADKARAMGKGYSENIVGSGTDDQRDALDRRVEVVSVDCPAH
jgi:outer membrane protein OmpA-like peptidoglycan-associated protein